MAKVIMINTKTRTIRVENADKNIDWITVKGTHVPIEKGQSKSAAVKSFVEKKRPDAKKDETTRKFAHEIKKGDIVSAGGKDYKIIQADRNWVIGLDDKGNRLKINTEASFDTFKVKKQQPAKKERSWQRGPRESEDAYFERREKTLAEARKIDKVSDWYKKAYAGDDAFPKNKDITFDELANKMLDGTLGEFYEAVGVGESDVREKIFEELSERTGRPYDDFYDAWLHGGSKGTESRKKKQAESAAWMDKLLELHTDMDPELRKAIVAARDRAKKDS